MASLPSLARAPAICVTLSSLRCALESFPPQRALLAAGEELDTLLGAGQDPRQRAVQLETLLVLIKGIFKLEGLALEPRNDRLEPLEAFAKARFTGFLVHEIPLVFQ